MVPMHYEKAGGHRDKNLTDFKLLEFLPPECLPESSVFTDSDSVIEIGIESVLVGVFSLKVKFNKKLHGLVDFLL